MIEYLEHHIVDHCNLNCGGCSHFSPLADEWYENIDDFIYDFQALANKTDNYVPVIRLMGGEPLLHPQYDDFLHVARTLFPNSNIQIVTNGLLLQKEHDKLVKVCNERDIQICTSNYGLKLDLNKLLKDYKYTRVDNKNSLYNISLDLNGNYDAEETFRYCDLHVNHWYYFQDGRFFPCCIAANIRFFENYFHIFLGNEEEYPRKLDDISISIHNHSIQEIQEFLNKPIQLCRFCNTIQRQQSYQPFKVSKKSIKEWICQ